MIVKLYWVSSYINCLYAEFENTKSPGKFLNSRIFFKFSLKKIKLNFFSYIKDKKGEDSAPEINTDSENDDENNATTIKKPSDICNLILQKASLLNQK